MDENNNGTPSVPATGEAELITMSKTDWEKTQRELSQAKFTLQQNRVTGSAQVSNQPPITDVYPQDVQSPAVTMDVLTLELRKARASDVAFREANGDANLQSAIYNAYLNDIKQTEDVEGDIRKCMAIVGGSQVQGQATEQIRSALSQRMSSMSPAPSSPAPMVTEKKFNDVEQALVDGLTRHLGSQAGDAIKSKMGIK